MSANSATNSGSTFTSSADLAGLLHLFKARSADLWNSSERNQVLQETNALLLNGIVSQLVGELRSDTDAATSATAAPSAALNQFGWGFPQQQSMQQQSMQQQQQQQASTLPDLNILRVKAEILFFICYQTQIESGELTQLVALVKGLSNKLVKSDDFQSAPHLDWQAPLFTLLVILQLTLVCALQQTTYLLSRHTDYSQMSVEDVEVGNNLPQRAGDRHHMDDNDWLCAGAKGFCCMAFAVLRQPEVDMDNLPAADVEWFLHEASRLRAYSYIRLCVLPVIQCATLQNKSTGLFYMSVLCELMENMAKIYCMTHYKQSYNNNESDFPYVFFPPTQQFYLDNQAFFRKKLQQSGLPIPRHLLDHPSPVDSLEDVMALFGAICDMRPEFSYIFWPPNEPEDESEEQQEARLSSTAQQPHHQYSVHPFLMKAVDSSFHYSSLLTATIRFVASLSYDPLQKLAYAAYHFVSNARYDAMSWDYCLSQIDSAASKLGSTAPITTTPSQGYFESAQRLSSDALSLHGQHTFGEHDVEELIAILKLISAVSRNKYVARLFVENYKIVSRLFSLIVCNMPVDLKGATLQTLAVFADLGGSVTSEIWELMEVHRLLPFATNSWSTQHQQSVTHQSKIALQTRLAPSPNPNSFMSYQNKLSTPQSTAVWNPFDGQSILNRQANKGLRVELEDAESRIGCYPVTDSFLLLLESLFSQGIPNDLGGEYRLPGVVFYLEYVIDDILCKAKERLYAPQNSPSAYAQRFRLTSRAIKLLSMVLQHYRINEVSVDTLLSSRQRQPNSETTSLDPELLEIVKDFQEIEVEFQIDGVSKQKLRPKSAGFFVMSLLLSRSRLMDLLLELLKECDIAAMNAAFDSLSLFEIGSAFDLTQKIYQHSHHQDQIYSSALGQRVRMPGLIEDVQPMQLTNLGGDRNVSDLVYWQERVVSAVMGLLYECSLRENGFNTLLVASGEKLTITRSEAGRPTSQTVLAYSFADLLASGLNGQAMAVLAHFVQLSARTNPCLPALNVLAIHLLEHVALSMQPEKLISTVMTGSESTFLTSVGLAEKYKRRFMDGCVTAIADSSDFTLIGSGINSLHYDILTIGGNFYPDLYSQASTDNLTASPPLQVTAYSIPTTASLSYRHITSSLDSTFVGVEGRWTPASPQPSRHEQHHHVSERKMSTARELQHGYASAREAMVSMLLSTLLFDHVCLSHYLSGVALQHGRVATWQSSADHSKVNCLTAIIDLLSPNNFINGSTVLQQHPQITMDCFEYVYRLCASPLSSKSTLSILRDKSVNFIMVQLSVLLYLLHVTDDELLEGVTPSLPHSYELRTTLSTVESLKAALNTCVAWLFKICALEIRQAQLAMSSGATDNDDGGHILYAKKLSQLLLTHCSRLSFLGDRGTDRSVLVKVLETVVSVSNAPVISSAGSMMSSLSPSVKEMLNDCLISVDLFKGGRGWKDNKFCMVDNGLGVFKAIDLYRLNSSGQSVHRGSHFPAKQISRDNQLHSSASGRQEKDSLQEISQIVNECNRLLSATNHLCYSWRQLVDVLVSDRNFLCSTAGRGQSMQDLSYSLHEELLKPILHTLLANPSLDMVLAEQFVRSMMAILKCFLSGSDASIFDAGSQGRQQELFNILLSLLVRRKSAADAWVASTAFTPSSITFRGFLTVSVTLLLQVGSGIDSVDSFNDYTSASSEEDKSEARYLVSRDNDNFHYLTESLESCVSDVVEVLATDAVDGPILWRLSAISALSAVFHRLCPSATSFGGARLSLNSVRFGRRRAGLRDGYGSAAFVQALQVIHLRGYLHKLLTSCLCNPTMGNAQEQELLFTNTMVLCVSVASSVEGVEALVANGILDHVIDLQYFVDPPPFPEELLAYGMETQATQQELTLLLQRRLQPVLQLLRMMCATSPSQQLLHGVARFVQKNSKMVSNLMRLRYLSLNGLRLTESLIGLLAEAITCMDVVRISGEEVEISSHWEILFGHLSMDSLNDVWLLLGTLGCSPFPAELFLPFSARSVEEHKSRTGSSESSGWWYRIEPVTPHEKELGHINYSRGTSIRDKGVKKWSRFDEAKLTYSLGIASNVSCLLRAITMSQIQPKPNFSSQSKVFSHYLLGMSADAVVGSFCQCSHLALTATQVLGEHTSPGPSNNLLLTGPKGFENNASFHDSQSPAISIKNKLSYTVENLACAIHCLALIAEDNLRNPVPMNQAFNAVDSILRERREQANGWITSLRGCVKAAQLYPLHSFIHNVLRVVQDFDGNNTYQTPYGSRPVETLD